MVPRRSVSYFQDMLHVVNSTIPYTGLSVSHISVFLISKIACLTTQPEQLSFYCMLPEIARGRFIPLRPPAFLPRKHANHSYPMVNLYPLADALRDHISQFFLILCIQMHTIRVTCANILCRVEIFTVIHIRQCLIPAGQFL